MRTKCRTIPARAGGPTGPDDGGGGGPAEDATPRPLPSSRHVMHGTEKDVTAIGGSGGSPCVPCGGPIRPSPRGAPRRWWSHSALPGSPHTDKQNSSLFYGMSAGEFDEGTGCVTVECSARVIAKVDTRNRLGRFDGRYPNWVTHYDPGQERFSLFYHDTLTTFESTGPAIFRVP
jgi:hypothetical protein